ncbi:unnamed protein product [Camellia sinensis]
MATDSFSVETLVGEGSIGCVYRAQFDDGKVLAVKKINSSALPNHLSEDFMDIVSDISRLRHPNITELVGYCSEHGQHLLVYEFHKNGSLYDFLHLSDEFSKPLTWKKRVKIALGTARAQDGYRFTGGRIAGSRLQVYLPLLPVDGLRAGRCSSEQ